MTDFEIEKSAESPASPKKGTAAIFNQDFLSGLEKSRLNPFVNEGDAATEFLRVMNGQTPSPYDIARAQLGGPATAGFAASSIKESGASIEKVSIKEAAIGDHIKLTGGAEGFITKPIVNAAGDTLGFTVLRDSNGKASAGYYPVSQVEEISRGLSGTAPQMRNRSDLHRTAEETAQLEQYKDAARAVADKYDIGIHAAALLCKVTETTDPANLGAVEKLGADFKGSKFVSSMTDAQAIYAIGKTAAFPEAEKIKVTGEKFTTTISINPETAAAIKSAVETMKDPAMQVWAHHKTNCWNVSPTIITPKTDAAPAAPQATSKNDGPKQGM